MIALLVTLALAMAPDDLPPRMGEMLRNDSLEEFERTHYPILIFAPSERDEAYRDQLRRLEGDAAKLRDRSAVVVSLFQFRGGVVGDQRIDQTDVAAIRRKYDVPGDAFTVILLGQDGSVKHRGREPLAADDLLRRIGAQKDDSGAKPR